MSENWTKRCYARNLIDNHITEDDPAFMSRFDPQNYVAMLKQAGADAVMVFACCHNGNCYYPSKVGHMHRNLHGLDMFGEIVSGLRKAGIVAMGYYTVIYHNHAAKENPSWRMIDAAGQQSKGRYWFCCPNSADSVEFYKKQIAEIIEYDIEGIFIDMTFWPMVCVCQKCQQRYLSETGEEIPGVVNWEEAGWVGFQRTRERWMGEFAETITNFIKKSKPSMTVVHQFSPVLAGWSLAQSPETAAASDYPSGDFYGGRYQHLLGTRVMDAFCHDDMPFEFMTSRCVNLLDHTSIKSEGELLCSAATTLAAGGAYFFIDAINPDGTLEPRVYNRLGRVGRQVLPFKEEVQSLRPRLMGDIGLYFSMASFDDPRLNGTSLKDLSLFNSNMLLDVGMPSAIKELLGTSVLLSRSNLPYQIVRADRDDSIGGGALIVNNAKYMCEDEVGRLREFVSGGGTLIATGLTSLCNMEGETTGDFSLADVFGVSYSGRKSMRINYLLDAEHGHILADEAAPLVRATTAESLVAWHTTGCPASIRPSATAAVCPLRAYPGV